MKVSMEEFMDLENKYRDLEEMYNTLFEVTFGHYNSIEDFITAKKEFLERYE